MPSKRFFKYDSAKSFFFANPLNVNYQCVVINQAMKCQGQTSPLNTGRFGSVELSRRGTRSMAKDPGTELQALRGNGSGIFSYGV